MRGGVRVRFARGVAAVLAAANAIVPAAAATIALAATTSIVLAAAAFAVEPATPLQLANGRGSSVTGHASASPATREVAIAAMRFEPAVLEARVGDRIVWINRDPFPHTVVAADGEFRSPEIPPGGTWSLRVARAGDVAYRCSLHPMMSGALRRIDRR